MKIGISILCVALLATSSAGYVNIQNLGSGVRSLGLGNSFVAVADNTEAVFANPAGLGQLRRRQVTYTHGGIKKKYDIGRYMASFGMPLNAKLGLGLGYERIGSSLLSENGAFVSLSYQALSQLYVGVSAKYLFSLLSPTLTEMIADEDEVDTATVGVDVGLLWQSPFSGVQIGLFIKNVNQPSAGKASSLPMEIHMGAGYRVGTQALLSVQYVQYDVTKTSLGWDFLHHRGWMIGGETHLLKGLVLRAGREHKFGLDDRVSLSVGLGLRLEYREVGLLLDYAYRGDQKEPWGLLSEQEHRFSFACEF